ncbi:MAG: hypothetical protein GWM92_03065 [Gemmatimonadetes bacterium]|nr:ankyrin repeat domain-containing protein [Gemmatimonadota bacterium]NIR77478.1 ankyrin repeat domain-containing protein [Gemmatimonadota bacterium]NIT86002.1 ankyrin repeat domain-containing protein [Gemmatimonadota bacterium]NIU29822.1 ankyrin repeat domain-containing protein [Gemmatimonadota bacterium]NIU34844.1 hypothetical protein [Gemmatimonadota bacterium]
MEREAKRPKDFWDKLEKASTFIASVVLAAVTWGATTLITARQAERDAALREVEVRNAQLATVQGFMDFLTGTPDEQDMAILAISTLGDDSLAVRLGAVTRREEALGALLPHLARMGRAPLVRNVIESGVDPERRDPAGNTAMMVAAMTGSLEVMQELLALGASLDAVADPTLWTPLMFGAARGHVEVVGWLLENGAAVDTRNRNGASALWLAAQAGRTGSARRLVEHGASVDLADHDAWTPLIIAAANGHSPVVQLLVDSGADVDFRSTDGETALMAAAERGSIEAVRALLRAGASRQLQDQDGLTAGDRARLFGHEEIAREIDGR